MDVKYKVSTENLSVMVDYKREDECDTLNVSYKLERPVD